MTIKKKIKLLRHDKQRIIQFQDNASSGASATRLLPHLQSKRHKSRNNLHKKLRLTYYFPLEAFQRTEISSARNHQLAADKTEICLGNSIGTLYCSSKNKRPLISLNKGDPNYRFGTTFNCMVLLTSQFVEKSGLRWGEKSFW